MAIEELPSDSAFCPDHDDLFLAFMRLLPRGTAWDNVEHITSTKSVQPLLIPPGMSAIYVEHEGPGTPPLTVTETGEPVPTPLPKASLIRKFMSGIALGFLPLEDLMCESLDEWFCFTSVINKDAWARDYGLPDECDIYGGDPCAKVTAHGPPTAAYLLALLESSGYAAEGRWLTGDDPVYPGVTSTFLVRVDPTISPAFGLLPVLPFPLGEGYALGAPEMDALRCMLERYIPAHCVIDLGLAGDPWTPEELGPALLGWWDAEKSEQFTIVAPDRISMWTDAVGGYNPDQPSAGARPQLSPTGFNGHPTVLFEGINYHLTLDSVPFPTGSAPCEIWALVDQTALPADTIVRLAFAYGDVSNTTRRIGRYVSGGVNRARAYVGTGGASVTASDATVDLTGRHILRGRFEATQTGISVDNGPMTFAAAVPATAAVRTRIGSNDGSTSGLRWQGSIPAVLVTSLLTPEQATLMHGWLLARL